jgi:hypothetical protein
MDNKKLGIFFVSKNNYSLFDIWMNRVNHEDYFILNIDEDSTPENKEIGKEICKKYNIHYMDREIKGLQNNIQSACNFFKEKGIEYFIWFQHDCFPQTENFFSKFDTLIQTGKLDDFGVIGFNVEHEDWQMLSRSPLQNPKKDMWIRTLKGLQLPLGYNKPHSVESVAWMCAAIGIKQFEKHIIVSDDYQFFHAWDDIAFQFLYKNIHNICLPEFKFSHEQVVKKEFDIPLKSPHAKNEEEVEKREFYWGHFNHHEVWNNRWGFWWDKSETFDDVKEHYIGTLLYDFCNHNINEGPLKTFDL